MMRFANEISPEEAREYGLQDHSLTAAIDMRNPILQEVFMHTTRRVDGEASHVRHAMGITRHMKKIFAPA